MRGRTIARVLAIAVFAVAFAALDGAAKRSFAAAHDATHGADGRPRAAARARLDAAHPPRGCEVSASHCVAVVAQTAALVVWHIPAVFDAAATHTPLHASSISRCSPTATAAWWVILASPRDPLFRFAACVGAAAPMLLLGASADVRAAPLVPALRDGRFALIDQQTGGAIMWGRRARLRRRRGVARCQRNHEDERLLNARRG